MRDRGGAAVAAELSDEEAVRLCAAGADDSLHTAFRALYDRHAPGVLAFVGGLLGDAHEAEEVCQDAFVRLHRGLGSFDPSRPLRPWLYALARNAAIDRLRARKKSRAAALEDGLATSEPAFESAARGEERLAVREAIAALDAEHRAVVLLRLVDELTNDETARALECSDRTVRNRLRAACVLLERELVRRGVGSAARGEVTP